MDLTEVLVMENGPLSYNDVVDNLSTPLTLTFPAKFRIIRRDALRGQLLAELSRMGETFERGAEAVRGLYFQIAELIRQHELTDAEVKQALAKHFPEPRIYELLRVARAPEEIFRRYQTQAIGFRAALKEARQFAIPRTEARTRRQLRRSAERLVAFVRQSGQSVVSIYVAGCSVEVRPEQGKEVQAA